MIDFYAEGLQIARAMGLGDTLEKSSAKLKQVNFVDADERIQGGFEISGVQKLIQKGGQIAFLPLMRGDLERALFEALLPDTDIRFSESISEITQTEKTVKILFSSGKKEDFDLVIGADGIHSNTRKCIFGPEESFLVPTGYHIAIARVPGDLEEGVVSTHVEKDYFVMSVPTQSKDTIGIFGFTSPTEVPSRDMQAKFIKDTFEGTSSLAKAICSKIDVTERIFFDEVAQVHMEKWTKGRVALIGDTAACPTLLSGQGAIMAMTEAYVLAHELHTSQGNYSTAFKKYESLLMPILKDKMVNSRKISGTIIPSSTWKKNMFYFLARFMKYDFFLKLMLQGFLKPIIFDTKKYPLGI